MIRVTLTSLLLCLGWGALGVTPVSALQISSEQMSNPPTQAWLDGVLAEGSGFSWREVENAAAQAAVAASRRNRTGRVTQTGPPKQLVWMG